MRQHIRTTMALLAGVALAASAAACKKSADRTTADTAAVGGAVAPAPTATTLRVVDVDIGKRVGTDNAVADKTSDFGTRDTIVAVVRTEGTPAAGATLVARWTFQGGQVVQEQTQTVAAPTTGTESRTVFRLTKGTAWPKGKYTLHVLHNGAEVQTKDFEVK